MFKKKLIKVFAIDLAYKQKKADYYYYIKKDQKMSSFMLDGVWHMKKLLSAFGITSRVYQKAYAIYDFRNSGRDGYEQEIEERLNQLQED